MNSQQELQFLSEQMNQLQHYSEVLEQQLQEIEDSILAINELVNINNGEEMFVPLTNGVFVKANFLKSDSLLVNIGNQVLVEKDLESTKTLLGTQKIELEKYQDQMIQQLSSMYQRYVELQISAGKGEK